MKTLLTRWFWFVLRHFEEGDSPYTYKPMHRKALIAVGVLFGVLCGGSIFLSAGTTGLGFLIPTSIFGIAAAVSLIVGLLGSDRAVARIWGQKNTA